jgi:hypothetical protein
MKFNLRDLFWLMLAVGLATGWFITLRAAPPKASAVSGQVFSRMKPFEGRIFLRSSDGLVLSAPVRNGNFDLKYCTTGTYELIFEGEEADLEYLNDGTTKQFSRYGEYFFIIGSNQPHVAVPVPAANRRDNWRVSRDQERSP